MNLNIDLNLYKTFYIVGKYKSFTKASQELYISQPAVTQAIKKLEEQLNLELFKRTSKGIELTPAGEVVFYYSEKLCELALANQEMLDKAKDASFDIINVGVPTHIGTFYFVNYLKVFNKKYPNIRINIVNKKSEEMLKMLTKRELDIVIDTDMPDLDGSTLSKYDILNLESCFVCNEQFKSVAEKEIVKASELVNYPLILPGPHTANRKMIDMYFKKKQIVLKPLIEANSSSVSKGIISKGIGIGWMIKNFVLEDIQNGKLFEVKVDIDKVFIPVSVAYNKKFNHDIVKDFVSILKKGNI